MRQSKFKRNNDGSTRVEIHFFNAECWHCGKDHQVRLGPFFCSPQCLLAQSAELLTLSNLYPFLSGYRVECDGKSIKFTPLPDVEEEEGTAPAEVQ